MQSNSRGSQTVKQGHHLTPVPDAAGSSLPQTTRRKNHHLSCSHSTSSINALWGEVPNAYAIDAVLTVCCMAPSRPHLYRSLTFICRELPQLPISIPSAMLSVGLIQPRGIPPEPLPLDCMRVYAKSGMKVLGSRDVVVSMSATYSSPIHLPCPCGTGNPLPQPPISQQH